MKKRNALTIAGFGILAIFSMMFVLGPTSCSFGPPAAESEESYAFSGDKSFDHTRWGLVLKRFVTVDGLVNYRALKKEPENLDLYLKSIASADFDQLSRDEKLAFLINSYNAFTLRLVLDHYPLASIKDIPKSERWQGRTWQMAKRSVTLHAIEHEECRAKFVEPRVHFALNCASVGCPPLLAQPYRGEAIERQLEAQAQKMFHDTRWCRFDQDSSTLFLTKLLSWYEDDFLNVAPTLSDYVGKYRGQVKTVADLDIEFLSYDWSLNEAP